MQRGSTLHVQMFVADDHTLAHGDGLRWSDRWHNRTGGSKRTRSMAEVCAAMPVKQHHREDEQSSRLTSSRALSRPGSPTLLLLPSY